MPAKEAPQVPPSILKGSQLTAAEQQLDLDWLRAVREADIETRRAVDAAYLDVAKSSIDRARSGAKFVEKAAVGIAGAYAATLGLAFGLSETAELLPARGIAAGCFLGLSLAFAAAYVAFLTPPDAPVKDLEDPAKEGELVPEQNDMRRDEFLSWMSDLVLRRAILLRIAVLSLGAGVLFTPAPFIDISDLAILGIASGVGVAILVIASVAERIL